MTTLLEAEPGDAAAPCVTRRRRLLLAAPVYVPALVVAAGGWAHRWMDEDAFINLRIVDQIFAGHGPVFNAGERVESATSTVWLGILVGARLLFGAFASMEWITMLASLVAAVAAFVVAGRATRLVHRGEAGVVVPAGLLLVSVVKVVWDFTTSGLEMGLVWLWIAASFYVLVRAARAAAHVGGRSRFAGAFVLGLAPLVRPDLGLMMLCFLAAWFALVRPRRVAADLTAMLALPVAYQIFRMGYYATVVPSTALAKDAGGLHFGQGWAYAANFIVAYKLYVTAVIVAAAVVAATRARRDRRMLVVTGAMLAAGALHALYITAIGGDYMHGRLLLPAFFALALPASLSVTRPAPSRRGLTVPAVVALVVVWSLVSVVRFRPPANPHTLGLLTPISDFRAASHAKLHPDDAQFGLNGYEAAAAYARGVRGYFKLTDKAPRPGRDPGAFVLTLGSIGVPAYDAGRRIWVVDIGGLAEPLAARTAPVPGRAAGHRKQIDDAWYDARFGIPNGTPEDTAAVRALTCGPIPGLLAAVDAPLTAGRFLSNLWHSFGYTRLRVPADPAVAVQEWCPPAP